MWNSGRRIYKGGSPLRRGRGFTLMEVLIALAVLSVVLIALHQAFGSNIYIHTFNRSLWKAILYSHNELLRFERLTPPPISVDQGEFEKSHAMTGYQWKRTIVDDSPLPGVTLRKVELEISWSMGSTVRSYRSEIYVLPK